MGATPERWLGAVRSGQILYMASSEDSEGAAKETGAECDPNVGLSGRVGLGVPFGELRWAVRHWPGVPGGLEEAEMGRAVGRQQVDLGLASPLPLPGPRAPGCHCSTLPGPLGPVLDSRVPGGPVWGSPHGFPSRGPENHMSTPGSSFSRPGIGVGVGRRGV